MKRVVCLKNLHMDEDPNDVRFIKGKIYDVCCEHPYVSIMDEISFEHQVSKGENGWLQYFVPVEDVTHLLCLKTLKMEVDDTVAFKKGTKYEIIGEYCESGTELKDEEFEECHIIHTVGKEWFKHFEVIILSQYERNMRNHIAS